LRLDGNVQALFLYPFGPGMTPYASIRMEWFPYPTELQTYTLAETRDWERNREILSLLIDFNKFFIICARQLR